MRLRRAKRRLLAPLVLLGRRVRKVPHISRILTDERAIDRRYARTHETMRHLPGARVLAQPAVVVTRDWELLWALSPQLKRAPGSCDAVWRAPGPAKALAGRTLYAAVDGFSYYHWLLGVLPKLLLARDSGFAFEQVVVNPRHKGKENFQTEIFAKLGIASEQVRWIDRGVHFECEQLIVPPEPCAREQTELRPWARDLLLAEVLPWATGDSSLPTKLFISRAKARRRRLVNEDAVLTALAPHGFTPVVLEDLPLAAQIALFAQAETVVGLHGAGLANLVFSRPGTRVVELVPNAWKNPCFARLAAQGGLSYTAVPARTLAGERLGFAADASVDVAALARLF